MISPYTNKHWGLIVFHIALFLTGVGLVFTVGSVGFFPWNQSIVFDGGWRIYSGQIPFRDFASPNGLVPSFFQALFFGAFGVSWFSYILHAAFFNGFFAIIVFWILKAFSLSNYRACIYGLFSCIFFYTPHGVPYLEQHAFFFSLLAFALVLWSYRLKSVILKNSFLALGGVSIVLAYFSKQIPTIFFLFFIVSYIIIYQPKRRVRDISIVIGGASMAILVLWGMALYAGIDWQLFSYYGMKLPSDIGINRLLSLAQKKQVLAFFRLPWYIWIGLLFVFVTAFLFFLKTNRTSRKTNKNKAREMTLIIFSLFVSISVSVVSVFVWKVASFALVVMCLEVVFLHRMRTAEYRMSLFRSFTMTEPVYIATSFIIISIVFVAFANILPENCIPVLPLVVGLCDASWNRKDTWSKHQKRYSLILWLIVFLDCTQFHVRINLPRKAICLSEVEFGRNEGSDMRGQGSLASLHGPVYQGYRYTTRDLSDLADSLRARKNAFWYFGDASIIYAAAGQPSVNPVLWFHTGLTLPYPNTNEFRAYELRLLKNFERYKVKTVVLEDTMINSRCLISDFSLTSQYIHDHAIDSQIIKGFTVIHMK